jgi:hypothetical protein
MSGAGAGAGACTDTGIDTVVGAGACTGTDTVAGAGARGGCRCRYIYGYSTFWIFFTKESKGKAIKAVKTLFLYYD